MVVDLAIGILAYVWTSEVFGKNFNVWMLFLSIVFAFSPDADMAIFALLRKRLKLVSHHIIHFPLVFLPVGGSLIGLIGGWYLATMFLAAAFSAFVHDSCNIVGVRWLYPFSKQAYRLVGRKIVWARERESYYEQLRQTRTMRTLWDEIWMRIREDANRSTLEILLISCVFLVLFIL